MSADNVIRWPTRRCTHSLLSPGMCLLPLSTERRVQAIEGFLSNAPGAQEPVGHHGTAQITCCGELANSLLLGGEIRLVAEIEPVEFMCG